MNHLRAGTLHGRRVILAKPVTFMNNSGESVAALARFYKIPHQQVLVIADDLDQPTAAVRLRLRGGHGGHNGLRSIIQHLGGTHDFPRLKIGALWVGRQAGGGAGGFVMPCARVAPLRTCGVLLVLQQMQTDRSSRRAAAACCCLLAPPPNNNRHWPARGAAGRGILCPAGVSPC